MRLLLHLLTLYMAVGNSGLNEAWANEVHTLDQAWVFWDQQLTPADATRLETKAQEVAGPWQQTIPEAKALKGRGRAAYKYVLPPLQPGLHELKVNYALAAIEGWLVPLDEPDKAQKLLVGRVLSATQEEIPSSANKTLAFWVKDETQRWVLLLNITNETRYKGGLWQAPVIAKAPILSQLDRRKQLLNFFCTGAMLIMLLYQTMIFVRRTDDLGALSLAAICLSIIMRNVGVENFLSEWIDIPQSRLPHDLTIKLEYIPIISAPFSCFAFLVSTFRRVKIPSIMFQAAVILGLIMGTIIIIAKPRVMEQMLPSFQMYAAFFTCYCLVFIVKAVRLKEKGSTYTLLGLAIPLFLGILEVYLYAVGKGVNITTFGAVIFVFMQSQVLAKRFASAFNQAEHLGRDLQKEVDKQTWQIRHIMRHVPQGIGTVDRRLCLGPTYSDSMRHFFPRQSLESQRFDKIICHDLLVDDNSRSIFPTTLETLLGENSLSWNLNSHLLIQEARTRDNRDLAFEWNPIIKDGVVDEILVTVRDVSELKELRQKNVALDREFECYVAFSKLSRTHAAQAYHQLVQLLNECRSLTSDAAVDNIWSRRVLILLHTMKGNARQLGLKSLAATLHDEEQSFIDKSVKLSVKEMITHLHQTVKGLQEALDAIKSVMFRIFGNLDNMIPDITIEETLTHQFNSLWEQHAKPGQPKPILELAGPLHLLQSPFRDALLNVWLHLLTNSFDHGLYTPKLLALAGSRPQPKISLSADMRGQRLLLTYSDNGGGLNLQAIFDKAVRLNLVSAEASLPPEQIAALILAPGFSTRDEVSQSSGRGIGMDAVRTLLESAGVHFSIQLEPSAVQKGHHPFRLIMDGPLGKELSLAQ